MIEIKGFFIYNLSSIGKLIVMYKCEADNQSSGRTKMLISGDLGKIRIALSLNGKKNSLLC